MTEHDQLIHLLATRSARRGQFTLASGRRSTLYIDARLTTMSPEGLATIGPLGLTALRDSGWGVQAVGGLTLGADPVAYAISRTYVLGAERVSGQVGCGEPWQGETRHVEEGLDRARREASGITAGLSVSYAALKPR
jgi:hypothetical protein